MRRLRTPDRFMAAIDGKEVVTDEGLEAEAASTLSDVIDQVEMAHLLALLERGGAAIWAIAALSVATVALILWKVWRLSCSGAWRRARAAVAVSLWLDNRRDEALSVARKGRGPCAHVLAATFRALHTKGYGAEQPKQRGDTRGKRVLARAASGLRALELIATIAPLLGLFGTVLGMIAAFQALQDAGARADPAALAGGIWVALLTTRGGHGGGHSRVGGADMVRERDRPAAPRYGGHGDARAHPRGAPGNSRARRCSVEGRDMAAANFGEDRRPRRPSLTPMIDVVFLLLVFFMLAVRFGTEMMVPVAPGGSGGPGWEGPPRLVTVVGPEDVRLNDVVLDPARLAAKLRPLMPGPDAPVILRAGPDARLRDVLSIATRLRASGITTLVLAR